MLLEAKRKDVVKDCIAGGEEDLHQGCAGRSGISNRRDEKRAAGGCLLFLRQLCMLHDSSLPGRIETMEPAHA